MNTKATNTEMIFKCNLQDLRITAQLTKSEIADELGLSRGYYHTLENINKHTTPSFSMLERIAAYYKITVAELFQKKPTQKN